MNSRSPALSARGDILIVDDMPDNLRLLSTMLQTRGYQVRKAINGKIALHGAHLSPPDLILLDINMPDINGYDVCKRLKADATTADIPIVFISALDQALDKVRAFEVGAVDYITKPFQVREVLVRVENQLALHRLQRQLREKNKQLELEIAVRQRAEDEVRFLLSTTQAISEASDFDAALEITLSQVCQLIGWDYSEAWIPDETNSALQCSRGWYTIDPRLSSFRLVSEGLAFQPGRGLAGRVWATQQCEWLEDLRNSDSGFSDLSLQTAGLRTALGIPIVLDGQVLAVLLFLNKVGVALDPRLIALVQASATQLGGLIQRKKAEAILRQANQELHRIATLDGLTQIPNRRQFDEYFAQEWRRLRRESQPLSLVICDVDHFKHYNDTYGHLAGDDCLRSLAQAMKFALRRPADLVARYGGEEFAAILPNTEREGAACVAEGIRVAVQDLAIAHAEVSTSDVVTVSLGTATLIPDSHTPAENLIHLADRALYEAKARGRNCVVSDSSGPDPTPN